MGTNYLKALKMKTTLIFATLIAFALAVPKQHENAKDCEKCKQDIGQAIKDCGGIPNVLNCIEDILLTMEECLECICEILAEAVGVDPANCTPGMIRNCNKKLFI